MTDFGKGAKSSPCLRRQGLFLSSYGGEVSEVSPKAEKTEINRDKIRLRKEIYIHEKTAFYQ